MARYFTLDFGAVSAVASSDTMQQHPKPQLHRIDVLGSELCACRPGIHDTSGHSVEASWPWLSVRIPSNTLC